MQLFVSTTSPFARLVMIVAYRKGIDIPLVIVNPWDNPAELVATTPFSQVPALLTTDQQLITESAIIIGWFAPELLQDSRLASQLSYALSLINQAVRAFGTRRFQPVDGVAHPFIARAESTLRNLLPNAPTLDPFSDDWGQIFLGVALAYVQLRLPDIFQASVNHAQQAAVARFSQRDFMQKTEQSRMEAKPASIGWL